MSNKQAIMQCAQTCTQAANNLRSTANGINNTGLRDMLTQGAHHLDLCIEECQYTLQQMQSGVWFKGCSKNAPFYGAFLYLHVQLLL